MLHKPPNIIKKLFPQVTWDRKGDNNISLTFDDGPHPEVTPMVLDALADSNIQATFFLLGKNVEQQTEVVRMIHDHGHQIGNHTFHHYKLLWQSRNTITEEVIRTEDVIFNITNHRTRLLRPPYGLFDRRVVNLAGQLGYRVVMWSFLSGDFSHDGPDRIIKRVVGNARSGSIVVFHENWKTKNKILPVLSEVIHLLREKGFNFCTL